MRVGGWIWTGPESSRYLVALDCRQDGEGEVSFRDLDTLEVRLVRISRCISMGELAKEDLEGLLKEAL